MFQNPRRTDRGGEDLQHPAAAGLDSTLAGLLEGPGDARVWKPHEATSGEG